MEMYTTKIVGTSHRQSELEPFLELIMEGKNKKKEVKVTVKHEVNNPYDDMAMMVLFSHELINMGEDIQVGYISKDMNVDFKKFLEDGSITNIGLESIGRTNVSVPIGCIINFCVR